MDATTEDFVTFVAAMNPRGTMLDGEGNIAVGLVMDYSRWIPEDVYDRVMQALIHSNEGRNQ